MYIKCFATLRNVLRRVEAQNKDDDINDRNFAAWRASLKAAVEACYANPLPDRKPDELLEWAREARQNIRRADMPSCNKLSNHIRRAILDEVCRPAMVVLKSDKKDSSAKALAGLRTCAEAAAAGIIRVFADPTDDAAAHEGVAGKLRVLAVAFQLRDPLMAMLRLAEAIDPQHHLHLEFGEFLPAERIVSHEGTARFQQAFDQHRPVPVKALEVSFADDVAAPPPILTTFVNEQLVDAFWDWQEGAEDAPAPRKQTIKFAKAQKAVRSWSVVIACEIVVHVDAKMDVQPTVLMPNVKAINGNARNVAEVVVAPGGLTAAPMLRDVVTAALRHFHGPATQERFVISVQQTSGEASAAEVFVGAAHGAAKSSNFNHAGAKVHIVESPDLGAKNVATVSVQRRSQRAFAIYLRMAVVHAVVVAVLRRLLRGMKLVGALLAVIASVYFLNRHSVAVRQLILGAPIRAKTHRRTAGATRRIIAMLAHTIARAVAKPSTAVSSALRKDLASVLQQRALPFARGLVADVDDAIDTIAQAAASVGELKQEGITAMGVGATFAGEDEALVKTRAAIAAILTTKAPGLANELLPGAFVKDLQKACAKVSAEAVAAVDVILRQASLLCPEEIMRVASRCDATGTIMLPPATLAHDGHGIRTLIFAADRSGVVTSLDENEASSVASTLFTAAL